MVILSIYNFSFKLIVILVLFLDLLNYYLKYKKNIINEKNYNILKFDTEGKENSIKKDDILYEYYKDLDIYRYFNEPLITIIFQIIDIDAESEVQLFIKKLNKLKNKEYLDIIFLYHKNNSKITHILDNYINYLNELNITLLENEENNENINIPNLSSKLKGKFVSLLNDLNIIKEDLIEQIYNITNGKTNNIYEINTEKNKTFYIIKTKIIKDIFDNGINITKYNEMINFIITLPKPNLKYISIAFCIDNYYILNAYVAIISILDNKNYNTFISFYIILSKDFSKENKNIILSLYEKYDFFNISFYQMDDRFDKVKMNRYITKSDYFKLALAEYFPNLNKILYLDCDIIVYKDLVNLYEHNFNGNLILAIPSVFFGNKLINKDIYFNGGVLLLNLKKMREVEFNKKVLEILDSGFIDLYNGWNDQAILNKFFYDYIGSLEHQYNFKKDSFEMSSTYYLNNKDFYNLTNLIYSTKYPTIFHFTGEIKPYTEKRQNSEDWWFYAKKGKYLKKLLIDLNKYKK